MSEFTYTKSLASDFGGNIKEHNLHTEIDADGGITPNLLRIDRTDDVVDIIFDAALSAGEQTTLNTVISNHDHTVPTLYDSTINCVPKNIKISNTTYNREDLFIYEGSNVIGNISKIVAIGYRETGVTNLKIKITDKTNNLVIAENTFTDTTEDSILNLTPINNIPTTQSIIEVAIKKTGGTSTQYAHVESVVFYLS